MRRDVEKSCFCPSFFGVASMVSIFNSTSGPACSVKNSKTTSRFIDALSKGIGVAETSVGYTTSRASSGAPGNCGATSPSYTASMKRTRPSRA